MAKKSNESAPLNKAIGYWLDQSWKRVETPVARRWDGFEFPCSEAQKRIYMALSMEQYAELKSEHSKLLAEKINALMEHYSVPAGKYQLLELTIKLARDLYPERQKRGRKNKWRMMNGILVVEVERLVKLGDQTHGVHWACEVLAKREPWASFLEAKDTASGAMPAEALRKAYFKARDGVSAHNGRLIQKLLNEQGRPDMWERMVASAMDPVSPVKNYGKS